MYHSKKFNLQNYFILFHRKYSVSKTCCNSKKFNISKLKKLYFRGFDTKLIRHVVCRTALNINICLVWHLQRDRIISKTNPLNLAFWHFLVFEVFEEDLEKQNRVSLEHSKHSILDKTAEIQPMRRSLPSKSNSPWYELCYNGTLSSSRKNVSLINLECGEIKWLCDLSHTKLGLLLV